MNTKQFNLQNIHVSHFTQRAQGPSVAAAGWEEGGARFHFWFDLTSREIHCDTHTDYGVIYKNPMAKHGEAGYFNTRKLNATKGRNAAIVAQVFAAIDSGDLINAGRKAQAQKAQDERAQAAKDAARKRSQNARLLECVADIAYQAGVARHYSGDSRHDIAQYVAWAREFEATRAERDGEDWYPFGTGEYMGAIEAFTSAKLAEVGNYEMPREEFERAGWVAYPVSPYENGNFCEDLQEITRLIGSTLYEIAKRDGQFYIRRTQD